MSDHGLPTTRNKVQELQRTLYRAAKADPRRRFHALYDKVYRRDILERAWEIQFLARWPSRRAMQRARDRIRELTARSRLLLSPTRVVAEVNRFLRGWASYFCYGNSVGMTTRSGPTLILEAGPTPGCGQLVGAPPFEAVVTRRR